MNENELRHWQDSFVSKLLEYEYNKLYYEQEQNVFNALISTLVNNSLFYDENEKIINSFLEEIFSDCLKYKEDLSVMGAGRKKIPRNIAEHLLIIFDKAKSKPEIVDYLNFLFEPNGVLSKTLEDKGCKVSNFLPTPHEVDGDKTIWIRKYKASLKRNLKK